MKVHLNLYIITIKKYKMDKQVTNNVLKNNMIIYICLNGNTICKFFNQIQKLDPNLFIEYKNTFRSDYKYLVLKSS